MDKFKQFLKKFKIKASVAAVALVIIGLLFIIFPDSSVNIICYVAGAFLAVWGVLCFITFFSSGIRRSDSLDLVLGLTLISIALLLFIRPWVVAGFLTVILGLALVVDGAVRLQQFVAMNRLKIKSRWFMLAVAIVYLVLGTLIVYDPFGNNVLMLFMGISLIVTGVTDMIALGFTRDLKEREEMNVIDLDDDDIHIEEDRETDL